MLYGRITRLRRIKREDVPTFPRWFGDHQIREFLLLNRPISMAEEQQWFEEQLRSRDPGVFAIETTDGVHIGSMLPMGILSEEFQSQQEAGDA